MDNSASEPWGLNLRLRRITPVLIVAFALSYGCSSTRTYLATQSLPVEIKPAEPDWEITVGLKMTDSIRIQLVNYGAEPVHLLWGESAYIDIEQRSHPITPLWSSSAQNQIRATAAPGTRLEEVLVPVGGLQESGSIDPLLSRGERRRRWWWPFGGNPKIQRIGMRVARGDPLLGKEIGVFLVLERNGQRKHLVAKYALVESVFPMS